LNRLGNTTHRKDNRMSEKSSEQYGILNTGRNSGAYWCFFVGTKDRCEARLNLINKSNRPLYLDRVVVPISEMPSGTQFGNALQKAEVA